VGYFITLEHLSQVDGVEKRLNLSIQQNLHDLFAVGASASPVGSILLGSSTPSQPLPWRFALLEIFPLPASFAAKAAQQGYATHVECDKFIPDKTACPSRKISCPRINTGESN
jgi:hypothetical protein